MATAPLPYDYCCLQHPSTDPEAELLCPAKGIDLHSCRPIVGPIAYSTGYYPGYKKELDGSQTGRSKKHCRLELRIAHRTHILSSNHQLVVETIHLELLRAQHGQTAPFSGVLVGCPHHEHDGYGLISWSSICW